MESTALQVAVSAIWTFLVEDARMELLVQRQASIVPCRLGSASLLFSSCYNKKISLSFPFFFFSFFWFVFFHFVLDEDLNTKKQKLLSSKMAI